MKTRLYYYIGEEITEDKINKIQRKNDKFVVLNYYINYEFNKVEEKFVIVLGDKNNFIINEIKKDEVINEILYYISYEKGLTPLSNFTLNIDEATYQYLSTMQL